MGVLPSFRRSGQRPSLSASGIVRLLSRNAFSSTISRILTGDYVIPYSDREYVTASALSMLTAEQLRLARNEIYARKGRLFKDQQLQQYFNSKPWYHGTIAPDSFKESMLSDVEKANAYFILNYERLKGYIR